jgi:phosphoserine aminotransferase
MKKYNFNAGPSILPEFTIQETVKAIQDLNGSGLSIMEISHRSKDFEAILAETVSLFKELLNIPEGYSVLFLGGGASMQFCMIPYNFLNTKAAYLNTGTWASKALKEAKLFGEVIEVASSKDKNFNYIPKSYSVPADVDYFHITTNNTIFGTEIRTDIDSKVPLIADMSSDILSRKMDVSKYDMIYGGAQKNLGPAGVAFVIIKNDLLKLQKRPTPSMLDYKQHIENDSMYNTPPCVPIFACLQTLKWLKNLGGVAEMEKINLKKAKILYDEIDRNKLFKGTAAKEDRSIMNVCFVMEEPFAALEDEFMEFSKKKGMVGIKGHRSVGGFRASIYNAMPVESVQALVDAMKEFEKLKA